MSEIPGLDSEGLTERLENPPQVILVERFDEMVGTLEKLGILNQGGIFLADVDKTIRDPYKDASEGCFDRIPDKSMATIINLQEKRWRIAVVTNQPQGGHVVSLATSGVLGYTRVGDFLSERDVQIFAPSPGFVRFPATATKNLVQNVVAGRVRDRDSLLFAPFYKSTDSAVEEVAGWTVTQLRLRDSENVVWIGNTVADVEYAHRLHERLVDKGFTGRMFIFKLPDEFGGKHPDS